MQSKYLNPFTISPASQNLTCPENHLCLDPCQIPPPQPPAQGPHGPSPEEHRGIRIVLSAPSCITSQGLLTAYDPVPLQAHLVSLTPLGVKILVNDTAAECLGAHSHKGIGVGLALN